MKNYTLTIRFIAAVYGSQTIDGTLTLDEALKTARTIRPGFKRCLTAPDGKNYWMEEKGEIYSKTQDNPPVMRVGGQAVSMDFKH